MSEHALDERVYEVALYEKYGELLSAAQKLIFADYYLYDLSYAEIAESRKSSRAAVLDAIKKSRAKLLEFEDKLHLVKKADELKRLSSLVENSKTLEEKDKNLSALQEYIHHGL